MPQFVHGAEAATLTAPRPDAGQGKGDSPDPPAWADHSRHRQAGRLQLRHRPNIPPDQYFRLESGLVVLRLFFARHQDHSLQQLVQIWPRPDERVEGLSLPSRSRRPA